MSDLFSEEWVSLTQLARKANVSVRTVQRWGRRGCGGCVLETLKIGRQLYTTHAAVERWVARRSGNLPATGQQKLLGFADAERQLDALIGRKPRRRRAR
jgi:hypothetical protein